MRRCFFRYGCSCCMAEAIASPRSTACESCAAATLIRSLACGLTRRRLAPTARHHGDPSPHSLFTDHRLCLHAVLCSIVELHVCSGCSAARAAFPVKPIARPPCYIVSLRRAGSFFLLRPRNRGGSVYVALLLQPPASPLCCSPSQLVQFTARQASSLHPGRLLSRNRFCRTFVLLLAQTSTLGA